MPAICVAMSRLGRRTTVADNFTGMAQTLSRGPVSGTANTPRKRRPFLIDFYSTAVGKKYVMAITGIIGIGFVVAHMIGNLKVYLGVIIEGDERAYDIDIYGEFLRDLLVPILPRTYFLWGLRLVLIGAFVLHIHAAYSLTRLNHKARPVKYQTARDYQVANFASRTMRWTGIIVLLFLIWHLADLTWGFANPDFVRGAVYRNLDASLSRLPGGDLLRRRQHRPRHPPLPRHVVALPVARPEQPHGSTSGARVSPPGSPPIVVVGNVSIPIAVQAGIIDFNPDAINCCVEHDGQEA